MHRSVPALAVLLAVGSVARVAGATPSAKLVYVRGNGTAACPDESELRRAVATRIGYDPFFPTASKTVVAQVSRAPKGYHGKVQIVGDDGNVRGERELATRGDDCAELISAIALAVSIALDDLDDGAPAPPPSGERTAEPASPEPLASPPPEPNVIPEPQRADADTSASAAPAIVTTLPRRLGFAASLGPLLSIGAAPSPSVGGSVAGTLRYGSFGARLGFRADLPASGDLEGGATVTTRTLVGSAAACVRGELPFVCAGGAIGSFATSTAGVARSGTDTALLVTVIALGGLDIAITRQLFLEPLLEGGLVLTRHRVVIDGQAGYTLPIFAGTAGIHIGWRFL